MCATSIASYRTVWSTTPTGYISQAARQKGLKRLKGILDNRLPPVIEVIPRSGYLSHCAHLALTFDKFGCTRHRQNLKTAFFILLSALVCLTLTVSKLGGGSEKCKQVCFFAHLALTFDKFGCTRHSQGECQEGCAILYKFHLVFCPRLLNFDRVQVRRRFGKMQTSLLFRSPCTNFK